MENGALITPVTILITGIGFFTFVIFGHHFSGALAAMSMTPVAFAVIFGTIQNIMSKSSKYALFDPTKEMAYIPLDQESKVKGKAAIDVVGARLGKAGGSVLQQGLLVAFGSISLMTPYLAAILFVIVFAWILASSSLAKQFAAAQAKKDQEKPEAVPQEAAPVAAKEQVTQEVTT